MTQPRWTEVKTSGGDTFRLAYRERRAVPGTPWCDDLIVRHFESVPQHARLSPAGFDALVGAVRDADTLHQIRAEFATYEDLAGEMDPYDLRRFVQCIAGLLAPPPPDTGAET